ncbi:MAG: SDR family oxidoreductase [Rhodospirillaceae bacterium]|jgi:nucleoside-diphosphate-sugar epimerase|nr:SDR family oxidoreductase [Rhodospirillaceae bacterium]MBT5458157.1 SDR family oxidoreductase [Rhodospirillaceae bacterium]
MPRLFCFGLGYSPSHLAESLHAEGWTIAGTSRSEEGCATLAAQGFEAHVFHGAAPLADPGVLDGVTHLLTAVPPDEAGDPVLAHHSAHITTIETLSWAGYLSATSVYGDTGGAWVDETASCQPSTERGQRRVAAEAEWLALCHEDRFPVHVFRLAGIYGPGRSVLDQVRAGTARRIDRPDHLFSRIHVDDIVAVLRASMARPNAGAIYNLCDDTPAPSADVTSHGCELLGIEPPPLVAFDDAGLSPMARSFYADNRLVRNDRIKSELGVTLKHPDYRSGLRAILAAEG